jgi:hypothetical protein
MKGLLKKVLAAILICMLYISLFQNVKTAHAAAIYISVEEFSKAVAEEINVAAVNDSFAEGLKTVDIIRDGEISSYNKNITRGDALVVLNRADEYLDGNRLDTELVQLAIEKRISDIGKVAEGKREDVAKAYLKGFMKGYDNGAYSTDRELKVTKKITKDGALSCIKMLKDKKSRAKISPDGQLIRTTKLPKNAKTYPYILASYPNAYYEMPRVFEGKTIYDMYGNLVKYKSGVDYFNPVEVKKFKPSWYSGAFSDFKSLKQNEWLNKAISYAEHVFNVDYRTINDTWVQDMINLSIYYDSVHSEWYQERLERYIEFMKDAKTVVKSKDISADISSIYIFQEDIYIRVRVKYQIISTLAPSNVDTDTYISEDPYKAVLFSTSRVDLRGYKLNKTVETYFDICLEQSIVDDNDIAVSGMEIDLYK